MAGRLTAHALAGKVPLPHYDDYVCVIVDQDDPQTPTVMDQLDLTAAMLKDSLSEGFAGVYTTAVSVEGFFARWMRADHMAEMLAHNALAEERLGALGAALPPFALRVLSFGSHHCEAFFVDFPLHTVRAHRDAARRPARLEETGGDATNASSSEEPAGVAGGWRDPLAYLPAPLPGDWSVGARRADGALPIAAGPLSAVLVPKRADGRRHVSVYFPEHPAGRPVTREEARGTYERLVGCGRFTEMRPLFAEDAAHVSLVGGRLFVAPLEKTYPRSVVGKRTAREQESLIARVQLHLGELVARVRVEKRLMSVYCVILDAKARPGDRDGVVMTRELIEKFFPTPEKDPFHIRARFEEPRPPDECVVFVKHKDGVEEIHVSLEAVERRPEREA